MGHRETVVSSQDDGPSYLTRGEERRGQGWGSDVKGLVRIVQRSTTLISLVILYYHVSYPSPTLRCTPTCTLKSSCPLKDSTG